MSSGAHYSPFLATYRGFVWVLPVLHGYLPVAGPHKLHALFPPLLYRLVGACCHHLTLGLIFCAYGLVGCGGLPSVHVALICLAWLLALCYHYEYCGCWCLGLMWLRYLKLAGLAVQRCRRLLSLQGFPRGL